MAEITVPVKLQIQNLQSLVNDLQSKLGNLKVGSSGFKAIQNTITAIRGEIDKLSIQTGKPFIDASQFSKAERSVEKLEDDIEKVSLVMSRLKFSDLELTNEQKADIKAFEDQLNSIKDKLRVVKNTAKDEFLNSEMGQNWLKIDETAFSKSLSQITNNIRKAVADQNAELNKLEQTALDYQHALTENNRIKEFISKNNGDPLSQASLGDMYDKIFMTTAKGQFRYTNNGRNLLSDWLEQQLHLDDSVIAQIINKNVSAANVAGKLKEVLQGQMQQNQTMVDNNPNITAQVDAANAKYQELIAILRQVGVSEDAVTQAEAALRAAFTSTTGEFNAYKEKLVQIAQGNTDVQSTTSMMKSQLESLRTTLQQTNGQFIQMQRTQQSFNQMKMAVVNFMGFNQVLNLTKTAIRNAINHIKELDSVMNRISIVTDMSTGDLWNQVDAYSKMAQAYGVSIKGAYEVSQIYYQQGLQTKDVLTLTNETLKLAKISGLDYATTTDYMTTALRGFKMEMTDAARVVDVYSNLAAHTAVSQEELAVAMSKTASSMESVGATFEEASAMIGTMVAVTRESATNIGSAMKSIASRYGELTKDPTKLVDEEGEAMAFNKVDAALQSVGISMKTVDGQFREFTDVIVELGEKWSELDSTQQRYIATQFAGNRQQSRFLALVSNVDLLKSNLDVAMNSEDTGTLQALKALDSIESKTEQVRVAYQQFYTTIGAESVWKGFLDGAKNVINTLNSFPKLFGKIPVGAIAAIASIINVIKTLGTKVITSIAEIFGQGLLSGFSSASGTATAEAEGLFGLMINAIKGKLGIAKDTGRQIGEAAIQGTKEGATAASKESTNLTPEAQNKFNANQSAINTLSPITDDIQARAAAVSLLNEGKISLAQYGQISREGAAAIKEVTSALQEENTALIENGKQADTSGAKTEGFFKKHASQIGTSLQSFGSALHMVAMMIDTTKEGGKTLSGTFMSIGGAVTLAGVAIQAFNHTLNSIPWMAIISGVFALINGISTLIVTPEERLEELEKKAEELSNKAKEEKANYRTLETSIKKIDELKEKRYESTEAAEEYQTAVDDLAAKFPQMIAGFDEAGNIILDTTDAERILTDARNKAREATYDAAKAELKKSEEERKAAKQKAKQSLGKLDVASFTSTGGDADQSFERRKYFNLKEYTDENGKKHSISFTDGFAEILAGMNSSNLELTDEQTLIGIKELYRTFSNLGSIAFDFMKDFTGKTVDDLLTYMNQYEETHNAEELTPEFFEVKQLIDAQLQESINSAYKDATKAIETLSSMDVDGEGFDQQVRTVNNAIHKYQELVGENSINYTKFDSVIAALTDVNSAMRDYVDINEIYKGNSRAVVSAWQQSTEANSQAWDVLSNSSAAAMMVTEQIVKEIGDGNYDTLSKDSNELKKWRKIQSNMANWLSTLNEDDLTEFNRMVEDTSSYSASDIIEHFNIQDEIIQSYIIDHYSNGLESIQNRLRNSLAKATKNEYDTEKKTFKNELKEGFYTEFFKLTEQELTTSEEKYLQGILSQYAELSDQGYTKRATQFGAAATALFDQVSAADEKIEARLWSLINEHSLTTLEGIQAIQDEIKNTPELQGYVSEDTWQRLYDNIIPTINLAIQTATSDLLETWEDTSKDLSKALSDGVTLKEADTLITKAESLGTHLSLNDFQLVGNKLVLVGKAFDDYYEALTEANKKNAEEWTTRIGNAQKLLETHQNGRLWQYTEDERALLKSIGFDITNEKYFANGELTVEGIIALGDAIEQNQKDLANYNMAAQIAADQLLNEHERSQGIYKVNGMLATLDTLKKIASSTTLSATDIEQRSIKESLNSIYSTLLSDILSKGFENINLADYEGLIASDMDALVQAQKSGDYVSFVKKYAVLAGKTIDETNDLIAQAIEKQNETVSKDMIKDLTFIDENTFKTDLNGLKELANKFNIPLDTLLMYYNATLDEAVISIEDLKKNGIDLSDSIETFSADIKDSINQFFDDLVGQIKNGLSGSLSQTDVGALQLTAKQYLGITDLDFTETAEGLKLSEKSAIELYTILKQTNALKSRLVFDELNKSLQEANEHYDDISSIQAHIVELGNQINEANSKGDTTRAEQYQHELDLAKEILAVRSTSEDSGFSFMSNKIPGSQNNPLNYYNDWAKAIHTFNEALKGKGTYTKEGKSYTSGFVDYDYWYNLVTEMNNIAKLGGPIQFAGETLDGSLEAASKLIQKGADSLVATDTGEIKVALSGMSLNFEAGADAFSGGVTEGIQTLAKSQVDMLDGMIQLLETVVAMESLGDIDTDKNGIIDLSNILKINTDENGNEISRQFTEEYTTWLNLFNAKLEKDEELKASMESVQVNNKNLIDIANQTAEEFSEEDAAVLNAFYQAAKSGNYDLNNIMSSIKEVLASQNFKDGTSIKVGDIELSIHQGVALEKVDDGYKVGDHVYKDASTAVKATYASSIDSLTGLNQNFTEEGAVEYEISQDLSITVSYDETTKYSATVSAGDNSATISANSAEELSEGIRQYATAFDLNLNSSSGESNTGANSTLKYTIKKGDAVVEVEYDVKLNKVTTSSNGEDGAAAIAATMEEKFQGVKEEIESKPIELKGNDGPISEVIESVQEKFLNLRKIAGDIVIGSAVSNTQASNAVEKAQKDGMARTIQLKQEQINTLNNKISDLETQQQQLYDSLTKSGSKLAEKEATIKAKNEEIQNLISQVEAAEEKSAQKDQKINDYQNEIDNLNDVINAKAEELEQLQENYNSIEKEKNTLQKTNTDLLDQIESLTAEKAKLMDEIATLDSTQAPKAEQAHKEHENALQAWDKSFDKTTEIENNEAEAAIEQLFSEIQNLTSQTINELDRLGISSTDESGNTVYRKPDVGWQQENAAFGMAANNINWLIENGSNEWAFDSQGNIIHYNVEVDTEEAEEKIEKLTQQSQTLDETSSEPEVTLDDKASSNITDVQAKMKAINGMSATTTIYTQVVSASGETLDTSLNRPRAEKAFVAHVATGNIGLAKSKGTLMGELGPELVVSNGRYFVAGQNGPEMINLADDAIVFNHLQTKSLLEKGMSSGRGKAVTNERNAVSFATGNVNGGPAMASASAALAALKQLRAQWQALAGLSAQDLAGKGGGGGGGGGDPKAFVKELEKWYNWLQEIAQLEKEITLEESKRQKYQSSMIAMGREYAASQLDTLKKLKQQSAVQLSLNRAQSAYFEKRRKELNENSAFKALYQFDENGQLKYQPGKLEQLSDLVGRDAVTGKANYTAKEQYEKLVEMGYAEQMMYDSSGNEIKQEGDDWYNTAIQAFWDKIEAEREEMQSLHDDVLDGENKLYELSAEQNQILHEIEDNQIGVEQKVLKAIEDIRQQQIDDLQDEKDAIEKSSQSLINGLSNQLQKEQDMRSKQQDRDELTTLQRRLAILQRSGGSAAQIASLQKEISSKQEDAYFDAQQAQIDALQEATDNQLEKLQQQIDLMTEQLAYEKENGLLWQQVYEVMAKSPEEITSFIMENTKEYFGKSPTELTKETRDTLVEAQKFVEYREQVTGGLQELIDQNSDEAISELSDEITAEAETAKDSETQTENTGSSSDTSNNNNNNNNNNKNTTPKSWSMNGKTYWTYGDANTEKQNWINTYTSALQHAPSSEQSTIKSYLEKWTNMPIIPTYTYGGIVPNDQFALVHAKEGILTAEQTSILRNEILSNKSTSLLSLLTDFRDAYTSAHGVSSYSSIGTSNGVIIENATVEMNVARIDNDYDAQRAGEQALDRMLQIARKTQGSNRIGR